MVVCAYNAADTIEDCLTSIERLTYPDYEIILVNDGSRDGTSEIAHARPGVRVVDIPNRGLSAARNVGLSVATGEIIAYTDADVRVDRDWLTFLVQPFLTSDVVASGGPNVVPPDDSPIAQYRYENGIAILSDLCALFAAKRHTVSSSNLRPFGCIDRQGCSIQRSIEFN